MTAHPALQTMLRNQEAVAAARRPVETSVVYQSDVDRPGHTAISITGPSRAAVQAEITRCMLSAENMGNSFCQFFNPSLLRDGTWSSRGEVIIELVSE